MRELLLFLFVFVFLMLFAGYIILAAISVKFTSTRVLDGLSFARGLLLIIMFFTFAAFLWYVAHFRSY